ncbi:MAG: GNAT family N-acetyltransferase [Halieaceae bacterium]
MGISLLMAQLGYGADPELVRLKLEDFATDTLDEVFVAVSGDEIRGVVSCYITSLFHQSGSLGRITSFVVDENYRGSGVGRSLVDAAESFFRQAGCVRSEVTSGDHRPDAHAFYESCGYEEDERRFVKTYH